MVCWLHFWYNSSPLVSLVLLYHYSKNWQFCFLLICSWTSDQASNLCWRFWASTAPPYFQVSLCVLVHLSLTHKHDIRLPTCSASFFLRWKFRLLGTPNEEVWPGVSTLKDWHEYPQWKPLSLSTAVPNLDEAGLDLLSVSLHCSTHLSVLALISWKSAEMNLRFSLCTENAGVRASKTNLSKEGYGASLLWWSTWQILSLRLSLWISIVDFVPSLSLLVSSIILLSLGWLKF